eukprot:9270272-Pyramimonas_sp.AAC.1
MSCCPAPRRRMYKPQRGLQGTSVTAGALCMYGRQFSEATPQSICEQPGPPTQVNYTSALFVKPWVRLKNAER